MALLAFLRITLFIVGTLLVIPIHIIVHLTTQSMIMPRIWERMICRIFGIDIKIKGAPTHEKPVIFLANHLSYLDILILGGLLDAVFVAKSEVAGWPGFGFLAKLQSTIFIVRKHSALEAGKTAMARTLNKGRNIILFGEGTTSNGDGVLPFKAGLLGIFMPENDAPPRVLNGFVQPIAIVVESIGGKSVREDPERRELYTWWRPESTLVPHLWKFAQVPHTQVSLHFLPVLSAADFADRKDLANTAHAAVLAALQGNGYIWPSNVPVAQLDRAPVS